MKKLLLVLTLSFAVFASLPSNNTYAYKLFSTSDCPKVSAPKDIYYWIDPLFLNYSGKTTEVEESINKWDSLPEIEFTKKSSTAGGADIKIEYTDTYSGDTYGEYFLGTRGHIMIYKKWRDLNETQERETIVHEVGHALGLQHTQTENDSISVMRRYGFNDKDYPLSDDKSGIAARY